MRIYIVSNSESGTDNISGTYYLITEKGEMIASHICSSKHFAYGDLYGTRDERKKAINEIFGKVEVEYFENSGMTMEALEKLNKEFNESGKPSADWSKEFASVRIETD